MKGVSGRYTKLAAKEKKFLKSVTIKRDSYDGLPEKIQKLFMEKIREYQLNDEEFLISDIDKITDEISNGKQKELNYSKYGFNSKQECIESLCVLIEDGVVTFEDDDMSLSMSEYDNLLELIESKIDSFGNELSIADFKQECKTAGIGKNVKEALKTGGFGSLKEYFVWISKTVEGFEFDDVLEVLKVVDIDGDESDYESAVEIANENGDTPISLEKNNQTFTRLNRNIKFDGDHDFLVFKSDSDSDVFTVIPICTDYADQNEKFEAAFHQKMVVLDNKSPNCVMFESNIYRTENFSIKNSDLELPDEGVPLRIKDCTLYRTMADDLMKDSSPFSTKIRLNPENQLKCFSLKKRYRIFLVGSGEVCPPTVDILETPSSYY